MTLRPSVALLRDECGVLVEQMAAVPADADPTRRSMAGGRSRLADLSRARWRGKLKRWFWCASFTGEYESSSATLAERDAPVLKAWLPAGRPRQSSAEFSWDPRALASGDLPPARPLPATIALTLTPAATRLPHRRRRSHAR